MTSTIRHAYSGAFSVQRRALSIPDLLHQIFSFVDHRTAESCLLVCRAWTGPALIAFWRNLDDPTDLARVLFSQLAPKKRHCDCSPWYRRRIHLHIDECPTDVNWRRYLSRARQVHSLRISPRDIAANVSDEVLELVSAHQPNTMNPTRLTKIHMELSGLNLLDSPMVLTNYFHGGVREVTLDYNGSWCSGQGCRPPGVVINPSEHSDVRAAYRFLQKLPVLATNVTRLVIIFPRNVGSHTSRSQLMRVLPKFHNLELFEASSYGLLTPTMLDVTKSLPKLKTIISTDGRAQLYGNFESHEGQTVDDSSQFPSLGFLEVYGFPSEISRMLDGYQQKHFPRLTTLVLAISANTSALIVRSLVGRFLVSFTRLDKLTIIRSDTPTTSWKPSRAYIVDKANRRETPRSKNLELYGWEWTTEDLEYFLRQAPWLTSLKILRGCTRPMIRVNENPYVVLVPLVRAPNVTAPMSLQSLVQLSRVPNDLQEISVQIRSLDVHDPHHNAIGPYLSKLRRLTIVPSPDLGYPIPEGELGIAAYLSLILPPRCKVEVIGHTSIQSKYVWRAILHRIQRLRLYSPY